MAVGILATITVKEGMNAEFETVFAALAEQVRANEPGNLLYVLNRSRANGQVYKVMEQYENMEAVQTHGQTPYFLAANESLGKLVAAAPELELLDTV